MREQIIRLSGMRQGIGLAAVILGIVALYHGSPSASPQFATSTFSSLELLVGAGLLVWSIEEHKRGNAVFTYVFLVLGLGAVGVAVRGIALYSST